MHVMAGMLQGLFRRQSCATGGENVVDQPKFLGGSPRIGPEGTAEVEQTLLPAQVMLTGAGPGSLQQIRLHRPKTLSDQAWQRVGSMPFPAGDWNEHSGVVDRHGGSKTTDQCGQSAIGGVAFHPQQQTSEGTVVQRQTVPGQGMISSETFSSQLETLEARRADVGFLWT